MSFTKIAVIGCGHWGPNHIRVFSNLPESRVVSVADLDSKRLDVICAPYPDVQRFSDYRKLLRESPAEAVVVASPAKSHFEIVKEALLANRHVLCEKPLCVQSQEAQQLVALAGKQNRVLMTGHVFLFNPGILKLKELASAGESGRIYYLRATRTNFGPIRSDVNSVLDLATHDISIFNFLLGARPLSASAVGGGYLQPNVEDVACICLRYPGDVLAYIHVSWLDPKKVREIRVVGEKRMLVWDELAALGPIYVYDNAVVRNRWDYQDYAQYQLLAREGGITIPKVQLEEPLRAQNRHFLKCVREGRGGSHDGNFAIDVVRVAEAIAKSMESGGAPAQVEG